MCQVWVVRSEDLERATVEKRKEDTGWKVNIEVLHRKDTPCSVEGVTISAHDCALPWWLGEWGEMWKRWLLRFLWLCGTGQAGHQLTTFPRGRGAGGLVDRLDPRTSKASVVPLHCQQGSYHVDASGAFGPSQKSSRAVYTFKIVYSTVIHTLHTILHRSGEIAHTLHTIPHRSGEIARTLHTILLHRSGGIALLRRVQRHQIYILVHLSNEMDRCRYDGACQQCGLLYLLWKVRCEAFEEMGLKIGLGLSEGPIIASTHCKFRGPVEFPDVLTVGAVSEQTSDSTWVQKYAVVAHSTGRVVAEGEAELVWYDYKSGHKKAFSTSAKGKLFGTPFSTSTG